MTSIDEPTDAYSRKTGLARASALLLVATAQPIMGRLSELTGAGTPIAERSREAEGPLTPAEGAFGIWGPLFLLSVAFAIGVANEPTTTAAERRIVRLSSLAFAGNSAWSLQAQFRGLGWPSLAIISASAASAVAATIDAKRARGQSRITRLARIAMAPLAGWLTVATFANLEATLNTTSGRLPPRAAERRAIGLAGAANAALVAIAAASRGSVGYIAAAVWGLGGVLIRNRREDRPNVARMAALGIVALVVVAVFRPRSVN